ncbi:MAG: hypothetical protein ABW067_17380 [Rhizobacter sp.]
MSDQQTVPLWDIDIDVETPPDVTHTGWEITDVVTYTEQWGSPDQRGERVYRIDATDKDGRQHKVRVPLSRLVGVEITPQAPEPAEPPHIVIHFSNDEQTLTVTIQGIEHEFTHDEHGHEGMAAAEQIARAMAQEFGIEVR